MSFSALFRNLMLFLSPFILLRHPRTPLFLVSFKTFLRPSHCTRYLETLSKSYPEEGLAVKPFIRSVVVLLPFGFIPTRHHLYMLPVTVLLSFPNLCTIQTHDENNRNFEPTSPVSHDQRSKCGTSHGRSSFRSLLSNRCR